MTRKFPATADGVWLALRSMGGAGNIKEIRIAIGDPTQKKASACVRQACDDGMVRALGGGQFAAYNRPGWEWDRVDALFDACFITSEGDQR